MTTWRDYLEPNLTPMPAKLRALGCPVEIRLLFWFFASEVGDVNFAPGAFLSARNGK